MVDFNNAKIAAENRMKNFSTPKALLTRRETKMTDLIKSRQAVNIDYFAVRTQVKKVKNKETGKYEPVLSKKGKEIMQGIIYIGYDKEYFVCTTSQAMLSQIAVLMDVDSIVDTEPSLRELKELCNDDGEIPYVVFETVSVKYRDGNTYDQPVISTLDE